MMLMKIKKFGRNMKKFGKVLKKDIEPTNGGEKFEYGKDFKKIRFESNDDLPINKPITLRLLTIINRCLIGEGGKFYPQLCLDDAFYELL